MRMLFESIGHNLRRLGDFAGRQTQSQFWPYAILVYGLGTVINSTLVTMPMMNSFMRAMLQIRTAVERGGGAEPDFVKAPETLFPDLAGLTLPVAVISLAIVLLLAAAVARRLHDKDRSALWALLPLPGMVLGVLLMPTSFQDFVQDPPNPKVMLMSLSNLANMGLLVALVVLLVGSGTPGPNRFGPEVALPAGPD